MDTNNLKFLQERLKYLGFGDHSLLNDQLTEKIGQNLRSFELMTDAFFESKTKLEAALFFSRAENTEMYILNWYTATIMYDGEPERQKTRVFHIFKGMGITFKQAFNLLDGRAAYIDQYPRNEEKYKTWAQLDFSEIDKTGDFTLKEYSYDLEKVLAKYPIQELSSPKSKERLINALKRGNLHEVFFEHNNKIEAKMIAADPAAKSIKIYTLATRAAKKKNTPAASVAALAAVNPGEQKEPDEEARQPEEIEQAFKN